MIKDATNGMPIALHGGSGSGDENIIKAVKSGINKVNMVTDVFVHCTRKTKELLADDSKIPYMNLMMEVENSVCDFISHWIDLTGSEGMAEKYHAVDKMGLLTSKSRINDGE